MTGKLKRLFERRARVADPEPLGEDMAPSPLTLAERSALSGPKEDADTPAMPNGPFRSAALAPMRDFTG